MNDFDVRAAVRAVVEETDLTDPGDIAAVVVERIPEHDLRIVLTLILRGYVRIELHTFSRWHSEDKPSKPSSRSAKREAIRKWARILRQPVAVEDNVWKHFGRCTVEDTAYLASDRRRNAADSIAAAVRFEKYVAAQLEHGNCLIEDLPDDVIASIEYGD